MPFKANIDFDSAIDVSHGALSLDVNMAYKHGWSAAQIERTWEQIRDISDREYKIAMKMFPEKYYKTPDGVDVFVGDLTKKQKAKLIKGYEAAERE